MPNSIFTLSFIAAYWNILERFSISGKSLSKALSLKRLILPLVA